jgi:hypothetical protein
MDERIPRRSVAGHFQVTLDIGRRGPVFPAPAGTTAGFVFCACV